MLRRFAVLVFILLAPALFAQTYKQALFSGMKWRGIGPYRGGRVLAVTAAADSLAAALGLAYQASEKIHFDGMHYRKDISAQVGRVKAAGD